MPDLDTLAVFHTASPVLGIPVFALDYRPTGTPTMDGEPEGRLARLEARVLVLERHVDHLRTLSAPPVSLPWWERLLQWLRTRLSEWWP